MQYLLKKIFLLFLLLSACSADPFPDCCIDAGERRDAPFSTTFLAQFKTGSSDIVAPNPDQFLRIITEADIMTLMNSAATSQLNRNGLIGGVVQGSQGPAREAAIQVTDAEGNIIGHATGTSRNLFYNSLGRIPDLTIDQGTSLEGTFTVFNVPPGETFFQVVRGGRGNGRITSFAGAVSLGRIDALPVLPERVGLLGVAIDDLTGAGVPGALAAFFGREQVEEANGAGLFLISLDQGLPTNGEYLVRLSAPGFRETTHRFNTAMGDVLNRQQAFDPLTDDNMLLYSEGNIQQLAESAKDSQNPNGVTLRQTTGVIIGRVTPGQANVAITPTGADPASLGRVFYFNQSGQIDPSLSGTSNTSAFVFFPDCAQNPGGEIFLNASAIASDPQNNDIFSTGRAVAYCRPGEVFLQTIAITPRPVGSTSFTVPIDGEVKPEGGGAAVAGATLQIIGSDGSTSSDGEGEFTISPTPSGTPGAISPLMANSNYTVRAQGLTFVPTYQPLSTGPAGGKRDLILVEAARMSQLCPPSGQGALIGTARDLGLIDPSRRGRAAEGITLKAFKENGEEAGRVVSFDNQGQFIICDLPFSSDASSLFQIRVTSPEDSGTFLVTAYPDGVTVVSIDVNKALPRESSFRGQVQTLSEAEGVDNPVSDVQLSVLGTQKRFTSDASGRFDLPLDSNSRFIVRVEKEGFLPSYNYQVETSAKSRISPSSPLWTISAGQADTLAQQAGIALPLQGGILAGQVLVPGFDESESSSIDSLETPAKELHFGFFDQDTHIDLLSVSSQGRATLLFGKGQDGFEFPLSSQLEYRSLPETPGDPPPPPQDLTSVQSIEVTDFNSDGKTDMVVLGENKLIFFPGTGIRQIGTQFHGFEEGIENPTPLFDSTRIPKAMTVAELNGDSVPDLVLAVSGPSPLLRLVNQTDGSFVPFEAATGVDDPSGVCGDNPTAIAVRQVGLAVIDILISDAARGLCDLTFDNAGIPNAPITLTLPAGVSPADVIAIKTAFLDLDNIPDFLLLHKAGGAFFLGLPPAQVQDTPTTNIAFLPSFELPADFIPNRMLFTDINRDSRVDLILGGTGSTGEARFLIGNGNGSFGSSKSILSSPVSDLALADADADGKEDLIFSEASSGALRLFRGSDRPQAGVRIEARNGAGEQVGVAAYPDSNGQIVGATATLEESGRFIFFNVPAGLTNLSVAEGGGGNALVTAYSGGLSYTHLNMNPTQPTTVMVDGQVINPTAGELAGISVEGIEISSLGTPAKAMSGADGRYQLHLGANSEHILKLDP
ncbi:MAG: VCBS repeat-containing protein [Candidatus Manganitrophus sp. SA1]|nr:VCBS repeat-containing protein [Candidatus Manganitrophus morganii]